MAQAPLGPADMVCPLHRKPMVKVCHKCPLWVQLLGKNPQTGQAEDSWRCAIAVQPLLTLEGTQATRQAAAESAALRNEVGDVKDIALHQVRAFQKVAFHPAPAGPTLVRAPSEVPAIEHESTGGSHAN